ncbi:MAG: PAS domain S-box protein [Candidatus Thiodiazotropha sp. (ex Lucinoma borealis)]|nr:PAS domain S-box protein [Candidatus Thiodiazotropha sp. (ex Lucinoma borealis)]
MKQSLFRRYGVLFSSLFFPPIAILFAISGWLLYMEAENSVSLIKQSEMFSVTQQRDILEHRVSDAIEDLLFLASLDDVQQIIRHPEIRQHRAILANDFISMMEKKGNYDQIRFLNAEGYEVVRVNYESKLGIIVHDSKLQYKGERYYFKDSLKKENGEVFLSPLDFNIEQGIIEKPFKPMIRFGTPIYDEYGNKHGIVIINYLANNLIELLEQAGTNSIGKFMLLNRDGYWLKGESDDDEWGFMFPEKKDIKMSNKYGTAWAQIGGSDSGQFITDDGMFTFETVAIQIPHTVSRDRVFAENDMALPGTLDWKLVRHIHTADLNAQFLEKFQRYLIVNAILVILWGFVAILLSRASLYKAGAQKALHEKEEKISEIINSAFDGIITINERGVIETFNPAACKMFGYDEDEVIGEKVNMLMNSPDREYHDLHIQNFIESGVGKFIGQPGRVTGIKKDGKGIDIEINIGAKKIHSNWLFTAVCRQYYNEIAVFDQTKQGTQVRSNDITSVSDDPV